MGSVKVTATFKPDKAFAAKHEKAVLQALEMTGEAVRGDILISQTMPFDTGALQNDLTFVDFSQASEGKVALVSSGPYARRQYYGVDQGFNYQVLKNPSASGRWFDPYLPGHARGNFVREAFARFYRKRMGL